MDLGRIRRLLLGIVVGASFGVVIGALVASWILGRAAGADDIGRGVAIALAAALAFGVTGGVVGWRVDVGDAAPLRPEDVEGSALPSGAAADGEQFE